MLKSVRWAVAAVVAVTAMGAVVADAARWQVTELGATRPFYAEHRFGVNESGRAAWTALVSGAPRARGYTGSDSVDLHALLPAGSSLSYGQDTAGHSHIVGYSATSARESERRAVLWRWTGASWTSVLDLHAAAVAAAGAPQQQTAAYAVSDAVAGGEIYVAGFRREQVGSGGTYSVPLVWAIDPLATGVTDVRELDLGGYQYGVAYGVTEDGMVVGGVGYATGGASYMVAAWWELSVDADNDGRPDLNLVPGMQVADGWSTSVANRVRRLTINGDVGSYAVGTGFDSGGVLHAFVHRVGPGGWTDADGFVLPGGANALAFDVTVGEIAGQQGLQVVGASNTITGALEHEPNTAHGTDGAFLLDVGPQSQVCSVMDSLPASAASIDMLNGAHTDTRRVGWGGGTAYVLQRQATATGATVYVRDVPTRGTSPSYRYFWGQRAGNNLDGSVLWSSSAGCAVADGCLDGALDLSDGGAPGTDHLRAPFVAASGGQVRTAVVDGYLPQSRYAFVQASAGTSGGACELTDVQPTGSVVVVNPAGLDERGFWCDLDGGVVGAETNIYSDLQACGASCGAAASAVDGLSCTSDLCTNGVIQNPYNAASNQCLISGTCVGNNALDPGNECRACQTGQDTFQYTNRPAGATCTDNDGLACTLARCTGGTCQQDYAVQTNTCFIDGGCHANNTRKPESYGRNPCRRCQPGTNQRAWSNFGSATCCSNGTPVLDSWDTGGGGALPDRNNGAGSGAWSGLTNRRDDHNWSEVNDRTCVRRNWFGTCTEWSYPAPSCSSNVIEAAARFNPDIDVVDWYRFFIDDVTQIWPGTLYDPEPRVRLISTNDAAMELCVYIECTGRANQIDNAFARDGTTGMTTVTGPSGTPAAGLPGRCQNTQLRSGRTVADIEIHTCSYASGNNDNANVYIRVRPLGDLSSIECTGLNYRLRWGNDKQGGEHQNSGTGCENCCN